MKTLTPLAPICPLVPPARKRKMKLQVIGAKTPGYMIRGKLGIGQEITIRHEGKVQRVVVVTTKKRTPTGVRYDKNQVMSKEQRVKVKGPKSKGLTAEMQALGGQPL